MKDLSKKIFILFGMCLLTALFIACPNNAQNGGQGGGDNPHENKDIHIKSVTLDGQVCNEGKEVLVSKEEAELVVELKESYEELNVKVDSSPVTVVTAGKKVKCNLKGITEAGMNVKIEISAKNKTKKNFNFIAKKAGEILIASVRLGEDLCKENETKTTQNTTSELSITFKEAYQGLNVKVNTKDADVKGKVAKITIENITEAGIDIEIVANATNKATKTFKCKVALKLEEIGIEGVTFEGNPCAKDGTIDTNKTEGDVVVTFEDAYEDLSVKINTELVTPVSKKATKRISNISEEGTKVEIEATAKGRKPFSYKFTLKKAKANEIGIASVTFEDVPCPENKTTETDKKEGTVKVTFLEAYAGLNVNINDTEALIAGKDATCTLLDIENTDVKIKATATGKLAKEYKFKLHRELEVVSIEYLKIEAKEIGSSSNPDQKTYSESVAPLLKEIASDGSTKVGVAREPKVKIIIKYKGSPSEPKLKVENITANKSAESSTPSWGNIYTDAIELNKGDNNIVVTYSEKGFKDLVYKFIVEYKEPEYEPIKSILIGGTEYKTKEDLEKLTKGTENFETDGEAKIQVEVEMPEIWYKDEGWSIKVDGSLCANTEFKKVGYGDYVYRLKKDVPLTEGDTKVVKIEFANPTRSFSKEYKANVTHKVVNKIKTLIFMNPAKGNKEDGRKTYSNYQFENTNNYYISGTNFGAEDREDKVLFAVETEDEAVSVQYAFSQTKLTLEQITEWKPTTKETIAYKDYYDIDQTVTAFAIKDQKLEFGSNFLYLCLQKGTTKTYYLQEIQREKLPVNDVEKDFEERVYKDVDGNKVDDYSPIAKKGLIRVLPHSPRAKVELATPSVKAFTLNSSDGYYECEIELTQENTPYSYNIIAEDGVTKKLYAGEYGQEFVVYDAIKKVRLGYKEKFSSWEGEAASLVDGKWYVNFDKAEAIKKDKKIYLFVGAFSGVAMSHTEFVEKNKENSYYGTNYMFEVNVASIVDDPTTHKEYTLPLTLNGKSCGNLEIAILLKDEIVQGISVHGTMAARLLDGRYVCKANIDTYYNKALVVWLYFIDDAEKNKPKETNRLIKVLKNGVDVPMEVYEWETQKLQFQNTPFNIADKEKITLKIQYFVDKTQTATPTKEYTLEIEDL